MIEIENIFPYTIVKGEDGFGIIDANKNVVVPCVMDNIINGKYIEPKFISCDFFLLTKEKYMLKQSMDMGCSSLPNISLRKLVQLERKH